MKSVINMEKGINKKTSILVVDDEPNIAEGLKFLIERYLPNCHVIGLAYDGTDGFEKVLRLEPDIVLADICMPQVDGIEMIRKLKDHGCSARFIILSGFAEFEYAQNAIALGVEGYLLKPVEEDELKKIFNQVCQTIIREKTEKNQISKIKHQAFEMELKSILDSMNEKEVILERLNRINFPINEDGYICTIFESTIPFDEIDFKDSKMKNKIDTCITISKKNIIIPYSRTLLVLILIFDKKIGIDKIKKCIKKVQSQIINNTDNTISIGIGLYNKNAYNIRESFEEARCALNYKIIKGKGSITLFHEIKDIDTEKMFIDPNDIKNLENSIDLMDNEACKKVIDIIFYKFEQLDNRSLSDLQTLSLNIILIGIKKMPLMQLQINDYLGMNILSLENIARFKNIDQLKNWVFNMLKSMNELMLEEDIPERRDIIEEIKEFINRNYNSKISLKEIAEKFFINPYYLSQLFKKRTGETYQSYLTGIRVSRAKRLLEETDLKLYEIGMMVGYADANYFNKVFENLEGVKPSDYRYLKGK